MLRTVDKNTPSPRQSDIFKVTKVEKNVTMNVKANIKTNIKTNVTANTAKLYLGTSSESDRTKEFSTSGKEINAFIQK